MGRHSAVDGESAHPLVAAALAGRAAGDAGVHRGGPRAATEDGGLGWPGQPDREGGGLGWPGDERGEAAAGSTAPVGAVRRSWRRLFGAAPAA